MNHTGTPYSINVALQTVFTAPRTQARSIGRHLPTRPPCSEPSQRQRRFFHDYFVTHLPSSSLSPDNRPGQSHNLPRDESLPHSGPTRSAARIHQATARETTIVRIPLKSAKHHFGARTGRGGRPYNEDTYQAGTIEVPAFAKRQPISLQRSSDTRGEGQAAKGESGDPQVFYFGIFDGHGGTECSEFLRERLHGYVEEAAVLFGVESSLQKGGDDAGSDGDRAVDSAGGVMGELDAEDLQKSLVSDWRETVGGYFKRFQPQWFPAVSKEDNASTKDNSSIESVLSYAFLKADLDFTTAQAAKHTAPTKQDSPEPSEDDPVLSDRPLNDNDLLFHPERPASQNLQHRPSARGSSPDLSSPIGGKSRFKGGSTASTVYISTPTPTPFWHPAAPSTLVTAHVGDTRILLCRTNDGAAIPLTTDHHPSSPVEATRLRRYAAAFVTDSFGEERILGLANTRAFGDIASKRIGVSAEPEIVTTQLRPAEYSFIVLVSDGVSGHLDDQEVVDVVKEARTPAQAATDVVNFAVETSSGEGGADNATALVVRLGGWERRSEGGGGSLGTKEKRDYRKREAEDPRMRRQ